MKNLTHILLHILLPSLCFSQNQMIRKTDTDTLILKTTSGNQQEINASPTGVTPVLNSKPDVFNSGFIDFQNSGQMNASARIFRIYIGEPKKFTIPISIYSGVSGNNYNSSSTLRSSEPLILGLINPTSGAFNALTDNAFRLGRNANLTGASIVFQFGEKLLIGQQATTYRSFSFFSTYSNVGILLQTGAWEKNKEKNMGIFWLLFRYHKIQIGNAFNRLSGYPPDKQAFQGYSIGMGIEINSVLNIKSYYYQYINPGDETFNFPIYQLTFNYSLKVI